MFKFKDGQCWPFFHNREIIYIKSSEKFLGKDVTIYKPSKFKVCSKCNLAEEYISREDYWKTLTKEQSKVLFSKIKIEDNKRILKT